MLKFSKTHLTILSVTFVFLIITIVINLKMRKSKENFISNFNDEDVKKENNEISASNSISNIGAPVLEKGTPIIGETDTRCPNSCSIKRQTINELAKQGYLSEGKTDIILRNIPGNC